MNPRKIASPHQCECAFLLPRAAELTRQSNVGTPVLLNNPRGNRIHSNTMRASYNARASTQHSEREKHSFSLTCQRSQHTDRNPQAINILIRLHTNALTQKISLSISLFVVRKVCTPSRATWIVRVYFNADASIGNPRCTSVQGACNCSSTQHKGADTDL
jgi:hypothetical protein